MPQSEPTRIAAQIALIKGGSTGELPPPQRLGGGAPSGSVIIEVVNDSSAELEILLSGPIAKSRQGRCLRQLHQDLRHPPVRFLSHRTHHQVPSSRRALRRRRPGDLGRNPPLLGRMGPERRHHVLQLLLRGHHLRVGAANGLDVFRMNSGTEVGSP